jgi:hypothetical protein
MNTAETNDATYPLTTSASASGSSVGASASSSASSSVAPVWNVDAAVDAVLARLRRHRRLDTELLVELDALLPGELVLKSLDLVHLKKVQRVVARGSARCCHQVESSQRARSLYVVIDDYCSCHQYQNKVLGGIALFVSARVTERGLAWGRAWGRGRIAWW